MINTTKFPDNVFHLTTPKMLTGGASLGAYENFNLASYVGDNKKALISNYNLLMYKYNLPSVPKWLTQVHSNTCLIADDISNKPRADSSWTNNKNIVCAMLSADCLPVFVSNKKGSVVGIIHAGYQGLLNGVIEKFIESFPVNANDILVHLGAGISQKFLALDKQMYQQFINKQEVFAKCFYQKDSNYHLNIYQMATMIFNKYGVNNITGGTKCTYGDANKYFSYKRQGAKSGRMANLIWFD